MSRRHRGRVVGHRHRRLVCGLTIRRRLASAPRVVPSRERQSARWRHRQCGERHVVARVARACDDALGDHARATARASSSCARPRVNGMSVKET